MQRSFIATLVSGVSSKPPRNAAEAAVSAYASNSLVHHLRGLLTAPFASDNLASILFVHEVPSVQAQALASVNRRDVDVLADFFLEQRDFWKAGRLFYSLYSTAADIVHAERIAYMLQTLNALTHVNKQSQAGALDLEVRTAGRFLIAFSAHKEAEKITDTLICLSEVDRKEVHVNDTKALASAKQVVSFILLGQLKGPYSLTVDIGQVKKGTRLMVSSYAEKYMRARATFPEGEPCCLLVSPDVLHVPRFAMMHRQL